MSFHEEEVARLRLSMRNALSDFLRCCGLTCDVTVVGGVRTTVFVAAPLDDDVSKELLAGKGRLARMLNEFVERGGKKAGVRFTFRVTGRGGAVDESSG